MRGRAGRQGDAGSSRFYLSMEDALMRIFASDRVSGMMRKLGMNRHHPDDPHGHAAGYRYDETRDALYR
ncbi:hypothetical protein [Enterobacter asburiae]|uniref:preprotein translocase subunit SecA n=1 Tax=Enterobacter asburiae TaxID=61645 RepID=UPI0039BE99CA